MSENQDMKLFESNAFRLGYEGVAIISGNPNPQGAFDLLRDNPAADMTDDDRRAALLGCAFAYFDKLMPDLLNMVKALLVDMNYEQVCDATVFLTQMMPTLLNAIKAHRKYDTTKIAASVAMDMIRENVLPMPSALLMGGELSSEPTKDGVEVTITYTFNERELGDMIRAVKSAFGKGIVQ